MRVQIDAAIAVSDREAEEADAEIERLKGELREAKGRRGPTGKAVLAFEIRSRTLP